MTELEDKTERLARMLADSDLDAVILNAHHNFAWLTGGGSNGVDLSRENGVASIVVTRDGKRFVFANVIEMDRMLAEEVSEGDFDPIDYDWQGEKASSQFLHEKARSVLKANAQVATDIPMFTGVASIESKIAACRHRLTAGERDRYRELGRDASDAMDRVATSAAGGETEIAVAERIRHEMAVNEMTSVVILVAADERIGRFRHPVPTANVWHKELLVVTCAKRHGLIASLSRMVSLGEPSDELKKRTEAAAAVNATLLDATRAGTTGAEVYNAAAFAYERAGFADEIDLHHQGGATGYRTRDWLAHPKSSDVVKLNQAFAWNPSITGTKVEETCLVSEDGIEVLTESANFPSIETVIGNRRYKSPGILSL